MSGQVIRTMDSAFSYAHKQTASWSGLEISASQKPNCWIFSLDLAMTIRSALKAPNAANQPRAPLGRRLDWPC